MDAPDTNRTKKIKVEIKEDRKEGKRVKLDEGMKDLKQVQNITVFVSKDNSVRDSSYFNYYKKIIESRLWGKMNDFDIFFKNIKIWRDCKNV